MQETMVNAAIAAPVSGTRKVLLLLLAVRWDGEPVSAGRLAEDASVDERSVKRAMASLAAGGLVEVEPGRPNAYRLVVPAAA